MAKTETISISPAGSGRKRSARSAPTFEPRFHEAQPFLARFLPEAPPQQWGLQAAFCDLYVYLAYLQMQEFSGYLHAASGSDSAEAWALLTGGRVTAAAAAVPRAETTDLLSGTDALGELVTLYQRDGMLFAYVLEPEMARLLSGLGGPAGRHAPEAGFSGLHVTPSGAKLLSEGEEVAALNVALPEEAVFPAAERPRALSLPRGLAGWAHAEYTLTLRGRDALSAITQAHMEFKETFGEDARALPLLTALARGESPADFASEEGLHLGELEPLITRFKELGYLGR